MTSTVRFAAIVGVTLIGIAVSASAEAQQRASIVGQAQDSTGAVLPGVTVEAASPELIERVRLGATDSTGRFAIVDLRPGTYTVTFALPGFKGFKREGIILEGSFTATVNAVLQVGGVEEAVIVTGSSPVVDLQSTQNQSVLNRQVLDVLPAARTMQGGASLVPGVSFYSQGFTSTMSIHGSVAADQHIYFDGMNIGQNLTQNGQQGNGVSVNELAQAELVYDAGLQSAENPLGGVRMDSIPREGGNTFSGVARFLGSRGTFQNDNVTDALRPFISVGNRLDYSFDANVVVGGPIKQNTLWFLFAQRLSQTNNLIPLPTQYFPQGGQSNSGGQKVPHSTVRLTWQASPRNKVVWAFYKSQGGTKRFDVGCTATSFNSVSCISPEASYWLPTPLQYASQIKWTSPISGRLLLEVGHSLAVPTYKFKYQPEVGPLDLQHFNSSTSVRTVASSTAPQDYFNQIWNSIANISYVTGSHNVKLGINQQWGYETTKVERNGDISVLTFVNVAGVQTASTVSLTNSPFRRRENLNANLGLFAQDKWTLPRLTLTYGVRYDYFNASTPEQTADGGRYMSAAAQAARKNIAAVSCLPCWNDWSVRLGASYHDLFGTGNTALKVSIGKFLGQQALGLASSVNPLSGQTDARTWTDFDRNGTIFDAAGNFQANEVTGPTRNANFGLPAGGAQFDPNLPRPNNWEEAISVQHALFPRVSVTAGYYHRSFYNIQYTKNTLVDPNADYTPFNITIPQNARLPNGGGQVITMYNLNPAKVSAVNSVVTWSENNTRVYNGLEFSVNARFSKGFLFGGVTTERTATDTCTDLTNSNANNRRFCNNTPPFQTLYKTSASYTLPYAVNTSVTFQARPGISIGSSYTFNSAIAGVAITGGGNLTVTVVDPTTQYYAYVKTVDAQISRTFRFGQRRFQPFVEIFNLPNFSTITTINETVGPNYFTPGSIVQGRRFQFGSRLDW